MELDISALDNIEIEGSQSGPASSKNKVDIVFVIDNSGSMSNVIEGVKNHITSFANSLEKNSGNNIDYRIGFVMYGSEALLVKEFTDSTSDFSEAMVNTRNYDTGYDEFGLPAIDVASDFPWEEKRHRFIIIFTDEGVEGGREPAYQMSKFPELISKLLAKKIKIYYFGVDSQEYREFKKIPGTYYEPNDTFENVDFSQLLDKIGKSVSSDARSNLQNTQIETDQDIYDVNSYVKVIKL